MENEKINPEYFKKMLESEQERLISELKTVGRINPDNPEDWEPVPGESNNSASDKNDSADNFEKYEENTAILKQLEIELNEVKDALVKIENGNFGICEVSGEEIEKERLEAYPAARTCKKHA